MKTIKIIERQYKFFNHETLLHYSLFDILLGFGSERHGRNIKIRLNVILET
jgi:hypothetical protein